MGGPLRANSLSLSQDLLEAIIQHCRGSYPLEACGIVSGQNGRAERVHCLTNVHPDPMRGYLVDTAEQLAVFRAIRTAGQELVAIFHSHPRTPAYPSKTDVELAFYPDAFYVIVSMTVQPPDVQAFRIDWGTRRVWPARVQVR